MSKAKRELRRRLAREQQAIETRLAEAVGPNLAGPVLGRANIGYELAERTRAVAHGGMGMIAKVVGEVGLAAEIDDAVHLLAMHRSYRESDHVLNIAYNALCGGNRRHHRRSCWCRCRGSPTCPRGSAVDQGRLVV